MGLLRTTCDTCGSNLWRWETHRLRECHRIKDKKKAEEQDLVPIPDTPEDIDPYTYQRWLKNNNYPVEHLTHERQFSRYTSKDGRKALESVQFVNPRKATITHSFSVQEIIERNGTAYLKTRYQPEVIVKVNEDYPLEKLLNDAQVKGKLMIRSKDNPVEANETTAYTQEFAKLGTAFTKENFMASKI